MSGANERRSFTASRVFAHGSLTYVAAVGMTLAALGISRLVFNVFGNQVFGIAVVGRSNILLSIALLVGLPASAGLAMGISRFVPIFGDRSTTISALRVTLLLTLLSVAIIWAPVFLFARFRWGVTASATEFTVASGWALLYAVYAIGRALLFAEGRVGRALMLEGLGLALFILALAFSAWRPSTWWLPIGVYPVPIATLVVIKTLRSRAPLRFPAQDQFLRFATLAFLGSAASLGVQYGSTLVGGTTGGAQLAGIWATLLSVASPVLLLPRSLSTSYLPRLSGLSRSPEKGFEQTSREHQRFAGILAMPATSGLLVIGTLLLPVMIPGSQLPEIYVSWHLLCLTTFVSCRSEPILTGTAALGGAGINASAALLGGVLCTATWAVGLHHVPALVAIAGGLFVYAVAVPTASSLIARRRELGFRPRLILLPGDLAMTLVAMLVIFGHQDRRVLAGAVALTLGGVAVGLRDYRLHRRLDVGLR